MEKVIQLRNKMKRKKPKFTGQKAKIKKSLKDRYRKPKGSDSKMRQGKKGKIKKIDTGYKSPKLSRSLHRTGFKVKMVTTLKELTKDENVGIIISRRVGMKKKIEILKKAVADKMKVLNLDPGKYLEQAEKKRNNKKNKEKKVVEEVKIEKNEKEETLDSKLLKESEKKDEKSKAEKTKV